MMSKENVFVLGLIIAVLAAGFALADPSAPLELNEISDTTWTPGAYPVQSIEALAGNITAINIEGLTQTKAWQGYYGNLSGTITLDDALNNTFYNWTAAEPRGEVYATLNDSITWANVQCYDVSGAGTTAIENFYGIASNDADGVDETYTDTYFGVVVGTNNITDCNSTFIFRDDASQTADFQNILLEDPGNAPTGWIYTAIVEDSTDVTTDLTCFNGQECDFQILVNEDGHGTDTATTTYYFWVELS